MSVLRFGFALTLVGATYPAAAQVDHRHHAHDKPPVQSDAPAEQDRHEEHRLQQETPPDADPAHAMHDMSAPREDPHARHGMEGFGPAGVVPPNPDPAPPPAAFEGPRWAADLFYGEQAMAEARAELREDNGGQTWWLAMVERLEYRAHSGGDGYLWDAQGYVGGDLDKLWIKTEGEGAIGSDLEDAEAQALWSHAIGPWFDLQAGLRQVLRPGEDRTFLAVGAQGLAPYMFEVDGALFLSTQGEVTARIEGEYDQRITQRLILQPRVEIELSAQDVPELSLGSGLARLETGLRLRFEVAREFAPYVGVGWEQAFGHTADFARAEGEDAHGTSLLIGLRAWF